MHLRNEMFIMRHKPDYVVGKRLLHTKNYIPDSIFLESFDSPLDREALKVDDPQE